MKTLPSVLRNIFLLVLISFVLMALGWIGVMPVAAVQVLLNTLFVGVVLVLFADILIDAPFSQKH